MQDKTKKAEEFFELFKKNVKYYSKQTGQYKNYVDSVFQPLDQISLAYVLNFSLVQNHKNLNFIVLDFISKFIASHYIELRQFSIRK